eukprot:COSAG01_NODE_39866_length_471_cov_0.720430_1_plen_99_part_10
MAHTGTKAVTPSRVCGSNYTLLLGDETLLCQKRCLMMRTRGGTDGPVALNWSQSGRQIICCCVGSKHRFTLRVAHSHDEDPEDREALMAAKTRWDPQPG